MSYLNNTLPSNEEELDEEDKTPDNFISSRPPIADPGGRNPAMEDDTANLRHHEEYQNEAGNPQVDFSHALNITAQRPRSVGPMNATPPPSISDTMKKMILARQGRPGLASAPPLSHFQDEKTWPPTGGPIDLSEPAPAGPPPPAPPQMPGTAAPIVPPPDPATPQAPANPANLPTPMIPPPPGGGGNEFGNYYLAGVQGAFGGQKATGQNTLGLELNKQSSAAQANRAAVMAAIATRKSTQGFTAGQNDLNRTNAREVARIRAANKANSQDHFDQNMDFKKSESIRKQFDSLNADLNEEMGGKANTPFARAALAKQSIRNTDALIAGRMDPNDLNPQEVFETAKSLDRVLNGGQPTDASTGHLTPNNAGMWIAEALQHMSNSTKAANAGEYVKNMQRTLKREYDQADITLATAKNKRFATVQHLKKADPAKWNELMTRHRLNDDGTTKPLPAPATPGYPKTLHNKDTDIDVDVSDADEETAANAKGYF